MATWKAAGKEASNTLVSIARLAIHLSADLVAFALFWLALNVVELLEQSWPLHGWAGKLLTHIHQFGVVACALWATFAMVGHAVVALTGRKLGGGA